MGPVFRSGFGTILIIILFTATGCDNLVGVQPTTRSAPGPNGATKSSQKNSGEADVREGDSQSSNKSKKKKSKKSKSDDRKGVKDDDPEDLPESELEWNGEDVIGTPQFQLQPIDRKSEE